MKTCTWIVSLALLAACGGAPELGSESSQVQRGGRQTLAGGDGEQLGGASSTDAGSPEGGRPETDMPLGAAPTAPKKVTLPLVFQRQQNGWYCGPSATRMVISGRETNPPSQDSLAAELGTTEDGTDHVGLMVDVLNARWKLSGPVAYVRRDVTDPPTAQQRDQLKKDVVQRISAGYGIVANIVSGWRPPFYPPGTWYHYVAVVGYDDDGDKVLIADPASGGGDFVNVPQTYWISTYDLGTWLATRGYTGGP